VDGLVVDNTMLSKVNKEFLYPKSEVNKHVDASAKIDRRTNRSWMYHLTC